jgi:hypothetical protein
VRGGHGAAQGRQQLGLGPAPEEQRGLGLGAGEDLEGELAHHGERAVGAGQELAQVVAGDVLHHPPAGLDRLAVAGDASQAEEGVARRPGPDPPRAREVAGEHAPDRLPARLAAQDRAVVGGLEGQLLPALVERLLDLGQRRAGGGGHHQLLGLVHRDAPQARELEDVARLDGASEGALGAVAEHLQGLLLGGGPGDQRRQLGEVARPVALLLPHRDAP